MGSEAAGLVRALSAACLAAACIACTNPRVSYREALASRLPAGCHVDDGDGAEHVTLVLACEDPGAGTTAAELLVGECVGLREAGFVGAHVTVGRYGDDMLAIENLTVPGAACSISPHGRAMDRATSPPP